MYNSQWYNNLIKPFFSPPNWIFEPVWTILYLTIVISFLLYFNVKADKKVYGYVYFSLQLVFNLLWSLVFFLMQNIFLAFFVIVFMVIFTVLTVKEFYSVSKPAGLILLPYLLWILYAAYLNLSYLLLN